MEGQEPGVGGAETCPETWESSRGRLTITRPARHVMLFTYGGYLTADMVPFVEASVDRVLRAGIRPHLFVNLEQITGYDSEYRRAITKWGSRTEPSIKQVRFLVRSRIVAMGVTVSNLASRGVFKATAKRSEFEEALETAVRRHA